ncbi:MAG: restriction endonuclease subunit S [Turicibacter sp.]
MSFNEWRIISFEESGLEIEDGDRGKNYPKKNELLDKGYCPFLNNKNLIGDEINFNEVDFITKEKDEVLRKGRVRINDIILTTRGSIGNVGYFSSRLKYSFARINSGMVIIRANHLFYPPYLYQLLKSPYMKMQYKSFSTGSAQPQLPIRDIKKLNLILPPYNEQKAIADILSSLDEKIELNNQMNQTLEEMAQALFKRWFVDFEFPNEEGQPYKSSGGEMVESELGMIPKGWELSSVYDLGDYINGTSFKKNDYSEHGVPIIKIAELKQGITSGTRYFKGDKDKKYYLENGDILFSWSGNPDTSIDTFIWHRGDAILNQHIFKVVPNYKVNGSYIYSLLKYFKPMFAETARNKQTTGLGHVTVSDLKRIKTTLDKEICRKYHSICESIIEQIINNNLENNMLIKLRDTLLPKLMSGEIRVSDFES